MSVQDVATLKETSVVSADILSSWLCSRVNISSSFVDVDDPEDGAAADCNPRRSERAKDVASSEVSETF